MCVATHLNAESHYKCDLSKLSSAYASSLVCHRVGVGLRVCLCVHEENILFLLLGFKV